MYSNITLSMTPEDGRVQQPGVLTLNIKSFPYKPIWLAAAAGTGSFMLGTLKVEMPAAFLFLFAPGSTVYLGTDSKGDAMFRMIVPATPNLIGAKFSFVGAVPDVNSTPFGFAVSNGLVLEVVK